MPLLSGSAGRQNTGSKSICDTYDWNVLVSTRSPRFSRLRNTESWS